MAYALGTRTKMTAKLPRRAFGKERTVDMIEDGRRSKTEYRGFN